MIIAISRRASRLTTGGLVVDRPDGPMVLGGAGLAVWVALDRGALALADLIEEVAAMTAGSVDRSAIEMAVQDLLEHELLCTTSKP